MACTVHCMHKLQPVCRYYIERGSSRASNRTHNYWPLLRRDNTNHYRRLITGITANIEIMRPSRVEPSRVAKRLRCGGGPVRIDVYRHPDPLLSRCAGSAAVYSSFTFILELHCGYIYYKRIVVYMYMAYTYIYHAAIVQTLFFSTQALCSFFVLSFALL